MRRLFAVLLMSGLTSLPLVLTSAGVSQAARKPVENPPTVVTVAPADGASGIPVTTNIVAQFSEAMIEETINGSSFTLTRTDAAGSTPVEAQVLYDPASAVATLDPYADLDPGATYTAMVKGCKQGVTDLAGKWLRGTIEWSFSTATAAPPPDTTPPDTTIDSGPSGTVSDTSASFTFSASEPGSTFECKLDDSAYSACTAPQTYTDLADGAHTFSVRATDADGNLDPTAASRTWSVDTTTPPPPPDKLIAITFDDGPDPADTPKILDVLAFHDVKATFFVVGREVTAYPDLVRRTYQEGHMVANHSYTHRPLTSLTETEIRQELENTNAAIAAAGVPRPVLFRPPYADTNSVIDDIATSLGMTQTLWDFSQDVPDWENLPPEEICDRAVSGAQPGAIMLLHDGDLANNTDDAIDCIITRLKADGYGFGLIYPADEVDPLNRSYVEIR